MKRLVFSIFLIISITTLSVNAALSDNRGKLIFEDEFNTFDRNRWEHLITAWRGGNNEFQYYTNRPENSYVENGRLFIQPTPTAHRFGEDFLYTGTLDLNEEGCNINIDNGCYIKAGAEIINPIQSARLVTSKSFSFTYGTVEVRAKMPQGDWIWPAIWLLPTDYVYGNWPRSGEIDMVEVRGNDNLICDGINKGNTRMNSALHWGPDSGNNMYWKTVWEKSLKNNSFSSDFHLYTLEWLPSGMTFKVDGEIVGSVFPPEGGFWNISGLSGNNPWVNGSRMAPFDQRFHLVMNVAVGGNFFSDNCKNTPYEKPWKQNSRTPMRNFWDKRSEWYPTWINSSMQVDYIRVHEISSIATKLKAIEMFHVLVSFTFSCCLSLTWQ